jgi:lysozyme
METAPQVLTALRHIPVRSTKVNGVIAMTTYRLPGPLGASDLDDDVAGLLRLAKTGSTPNPSSPNGIAERGPDPLNAPAEAVASGEAGLFRLAGLWDLSAEGAQLLKGIERLYLYPYDDQNGKAISSWVAGATIGYGHLIKKKEWSAYKGGISNEDADKLFADDLAPFLRAVRNAVTTELTQNQFDALVIFAFNIGAAGFSHSRVVALLNEMPRAHETGPLELSWKSWNKSQGKVMTGLNNRRGAEWKIFTKGLYERW